MASRNEKEITAPHISPMPVRRLRRDARGLVLCRFDGDRLPSGARYRTQALPRRDATRMARLPARVIAMSSAAAITSALRGLRRSPRASRPAWPKHRLLRLWRRRMSLHFSITPCRTLARDRNRTRTGHHRRATAGARSTILERDCCPAFALARSARGATRWTFGRRRQRSSIACKHGHERSQMAAAQLRATRHRCAGAGRRLRSLAAGAKDCRSIDRSAAIALAARPRRACG